MATVNTPALDARAPGYFKQFSLDRKGDTDSNIITADFNSPLSKWTVQLGRKLIKDLFLWAKLISIEQLILKLQNTCSH